jgi:hypothetical protein
MCCCVLQNKKPRVGLVPVVTVVVVLVHVLALPSIGQVCACFLA